MPVELVTPTARGSSSTQSYGTTMVDERRRPSVSSPSTVKGTIASSTVTMAIVRSSRCGFVTRIRTSPGESSTRLMSNSSAGGGLCPTRSRMEPPARREERDDGDEQKDRNERPEPPARRVSAALRVLGDRAGLHGRLYSSTSKKPIQPSSANSDWCAWNMNRPVLAKSISMIPRWPWQSMTVSVYSKVSLDPVG